MEPTETERKKVKPPEEAVLTVGEFDSHGSSRATFRDKSIEVEHGIPAETVRGLVYGRRRRWAKIVEVVEQAPDRVDAPCPHFHQGCGGCQWQMLAYQSQLERKRTRAEAAFRDQGLDVSVFGPQHLDDPWRYRTTAGISLGHGAGFRRRGSQSIVPLGDCAISHPLIGQLAASLTRLIESAKIPNFRGSVTVEVRVGQLEDRAVIHTCIVPSPGSEYATAESVAPLADELARFNSVCGVLFRHLQSAPRVLYGEPLVWTRIRGRPFALSAATFFQTNPKLLEPLIERCIRGASRSGHATVLDVYGGVGLLGLSIAPHVASVVELEIDPVGIAAATETCRRQNLANVKMVAATAESSLSTVQRANVVVVDPPRSGLTPKVLEGIVALQPERILYVSCLASSMARDVRLLLEAGYTLGDVESFDFYPQTYHLELFTELSRTG